MTGLSSSPPFEAAGAQTSPAQRLPGKVALITGAASGIGAAIVRRFVAEGAIVHACDIDCAGGSRLASETGCQFHELDVTDPEGWAAIFARIWERHGRIDTVINNAGVTIRKSIEDVELDEWNRVLAINLTGVMLGCRHALAAMKRNPDGSGGAIVNIASTTAFAAHPYDAAYTASKAGVCMLSKSVAVHAGRNGYAIRCNTIAPGVIETSMTGESFAADPALRKRFAGIAPLNRVGDAADIAAMAVFLSSDEASFVTGADFRVDGGTLAGHPGL